MNGPKMVSLLVLSAFSFLLSASAQVPVTNNSADIYLQLKKLNVLGSVLYIAAHPDDENNGFLTYLAKEKLYRTGYLSLTRGDGGQNLIGSEQGIELGLIRTQELLAARRIDGAEQYFSRAYEFGFSKSADEALRIWDREKILSDVVWMIRKFQPDIIITRFPGDARAGHGHHAASSIIAQEAYIAAADPKRFPEQFNYGVRPWQAKRILWNGFNFGGNNTTSPDQFKIEVNNYNPLLGKSYGELGGEARTMHKSQGEGRPRRRGPVLEYFQTLGGDAPKNDLMDGVVTDWKRIDLAGDPDVLAGKPSGDEGAAIQAAINKLISSYNFEKPELSVDGLVELYKQVQRASYRGVWRN
ncbi:MAG: family deacetylase, partial [Sediminibacterium sp.]|nr:family deacetylase [Sediminibacterium sp.]